MSSTEEMRVDCPIETLSNILGKKWVAIIIWNIKEEKKRFSQLQREIEGCSKKMLTQQLDLLIDKGIILKEKKILNNTIESTYYLSESGLGLLPIMDKMINWSNFNLICNK